MNQALNSTLNESDPEDSAISSLEQAEIEKMRDILLAQELSGGSIAIKRKGPGEGEFSYCATWSIEDFSIDAIANHFGGGMYKFQALKTNGKFFKQFAASIDPRKKGTLDKTEASDSGLANTIAVRAMDTLGKPQDNSFMVEMLKLSAGGGDKMMVLMMGVMQAQQAQTLEMMKTLSNQQNKGPDLMPLIVALISRQPEKGASLSEMLDNLKQLRELTGDSPPEESLVSKIITTAAPLIAPLAQAFMNRGQDQAIQRGHVEQVAPKAAPLAPQIAEMPQEAIDDGTRQLVDLMNRLTLAAKRDSPPELYAELVEEELSPELLAGLKNVLLFPNWFDAITANAPDSSPYVEWFGALREILLTEPEPESEPIPDASAKS